MDESENTTIPPLVEDTKKEDEPKATPKKQLAQRLATGLHTVTDKSKGALQSAAHAAESFSKDVVTSAAKTVKQGAQRVTFPFKDNKKNVGGETESPSITVPTELTTEELPPQPDLQQRELLDSHKSHHSFIMTRSSSNVSLHTIAMDNDRMVLWVVVASIAFMQSVQHLDKIVSAPGVPLSVVFAWMLVAFTVGMEFDGTVLVQEFKYQVLGSPLGPPEDETISESTCLTNEIPATPTKAAGRRRNPVRFLQRSVMTPKARTPRTCLERSNSVQEQTHRQMRFNAAFLRRLSHIGHHGKPGLEEVSSVSDSSETSTFPMSGEEGDLGSMDLDAIQATVLLTKMQAQPLGRLRGVDVFLTDCAECEMSTHPFLIRNGLRKAPTFLINMMTQWGSILIYMELPDWVVDGSTCLVEESDDPDNVKALKRFLAGDDDYRRNRLKIVPELLEAPYPIRLVCSKNSELQIHSDGWLETTYYSHCEGCPTWEVNVDCMGNSAIRGMASLIKRYLVGIKADFALVISHPDEPSAVLGMWRFDHLNVNQYPTLPDRYEGLDESVDVVRANQLVKEASRRGLIAAKA